MEQITEKELFEKIPAGRALRKMAVPTVISQMIVLIYNLADTFFIGQTGNAYMVAGVSLVLPLFNICNAVSNLVGIGSGSLISLLLGQKKEKEASKISVFSIYASLALALIWAFCIMIFIRPVLNGLGSSKQTYQYAYTYASLVVVVGAIPTILQLSMSQLLRAVGHSKESGFGISMGGVLNIILDPLFMFLLLPKGNEVLGAGLATMLSNFSSMLYFLITIKRVSKTTVLRLNLHTGMPAGRSILNILSIGFPASVSNLLFDIGQIALNKSMAMYGDIAVAAIGIVLKTERIPLNAGIGIGQGMMPIVAYNYGSQNYKRMKEVLAKARNSGLIIAFISIFFYELTAPWLMHAFIANPETAALGTVFLRIRCLATPFMFLNFYYMYSFQSMGEGKYSFWITIIRQLVLFLPVLWLMNRAFGMYGSVAAQILSDGIMTIINTLIFSNFEKNLNTTSKHA